MEKTGKNIQVEKKYDGVGTIASPYLKLCFAPTKVNRGFDLLLKLYFL